MRLSLFVKLILAFLLVVGAGAAVAAFFANRAATSGLSLFVTRDAEVRTRQLASILARYYSIADTWDQVDEFLYHDPFTQRFPPRGRNPRANPHPAAGQSVWWLTDQRMLLAGATGLVVFDSQDALTGDALDQDLLASFLPLTVNGRLIGAVLIARSEDGALEAQFIDKVNTGLLFGFLGAGTLALLVVAILAR